MAADGYKCIRARSVSPSPLAICWSPHCPPSSKGRASVGSSTLESLQLKVLAPADRAREERKERARGPDSPSVVVIVTITGTQISSEQHSAPSQAMVRHSDRHPASPCVGEAQRVSLSFREWIRPSPLGETLG